MAISLVYEDMHVDHIVGEVPRLRFRVKVEKPENKITMILNLVGVVTVKSDGQLKLGKCLIEAPEFIPEKGTGIIHLTLDMPCAKVDAVEDLRKEKEELEFRIDLHGVYAEVSHSSTGGYNISSLNPISDAVYSYMSSGVKTHSFRITREKWANILRQLKYGEVKIIELPILGMPEPSLDKLKAASTAVEEALKKFRDRDDTGSIDWARRAIDAITVQRGNGRTIQGEVKDIIINKTPDPLKHHVKEVMSRLGRLAATAYHFQSKFVKEQRLPERPYHPPTRKDAEFSINITADILKYLIALAS